MQKLIKFPLIFFFLASCIGVMLRWHQVEPIPGFVYPFWLHGHSHAMFLGWVFNALTLGFILGFIPVERHRSYQYLLILINLILVFMLISFPLQGYGLYSIVLSTLHTVVSAILIYRFFRDSRQYAARQYIGFARMSLVFFLISALGPLALGVLMARGMGQTQWYHLAVYFYLHFQYNGVFTFGVFALFFHFLEVRGVVIYEFTVRKFRWVLFISCFPAYALSTLWTQPVKVILFLGMVSALIQVFALGFFIRSFQGTIDNWLKDISTTARILLMLSFMAFVIKLILQLLSSFPSVAMLAYEVRNYVIAYLHLVLIAQISFFLLAWYHEYFNRQVIGKYEVFLIVTGFIVSEIVLISTGWIPTSISHVIIVLASVLMATGLGIIAYRSFHIQSEREFQLPN
jgi:hypothetical protein